MSQLVFFWFLKCMLLGTIPTKQSGLRDIHDIDQVDIQIF